MNGHTVHKWSSQPRLSQRGIAVGDYMIASSILLSGNNYAKVALFLKFLGLKSPTSTFFHQVQAHYSVPMIGQYWEDLQAITLEKYRGQELILAGEL